VADLVAELAACADLNHSTESARHLAQSSDELARAIHDPEDAGVLTAARLRLEEAAARAETEAPVATGVVRRLIDALAGIGI
jgi:hypothetical protein